MSEEQFDLAVATEAEAEVFKIDESTVPPPEENPETESDAGAEVRQFVARNAVSRISLGNRSPIEVTPFVVYANGSIQMFPTLRPGMGMNGNLNTNAPGTGLVRIRQLFGQEVRITVSGNPIGLSANLIVDANSRLRLVNITP